MARKQGKTGAKAQPAEAAKPGAVVAYVRVSTDGQEDAQGLDVQRKAIAAYAAVNGLDVAEWYSDVISGAKEDRPSLAKVRAAVSAGAIGTVLIYRLDRLARDNHLAETLWREMSSHGARVVSVSEAFDDSLTGNLMRQILQAFAEYERAVISTRTKQGRRESVRKKGTFSGGPPMFGYKPKGKRGSPGGGELVADPKEAEAVQLIFARKGAAYQAIADELNAKGYKTARGASFTPTQVYRVLQRENFYKGLDVITRTVEADKPAHTAIIS